MPKIVRLLITMDCPRECAYCCNRHAVVVNVPRVRSVDAVAGFGMVLISGGEPMLDPPRLLRIIREVRAASPGAVVYLYTALYRREFADVLAAVDGVHYTLHAGATAADIAGFQRAQDAVARGGAGKSCRTQVDPGVAPRAGIRPDVWGEVRAMPWRDEDENVLPAGEVLLILEEHA